MRLTVHTFLSLDATMQAPGGPEEDTSGGFTLGGWSAPLFDEVSGAAVSGWFEAADAFLLGRKTYDIFAAFWPHVTDSDDLVAGKLNGLPKYVPSRTRTTLGWEHTQVLSGDAVAAIRDLKAGPGRELQVHGSGNLIQTLLAHDLIDELRLITFPVLLGSGAKLFADGTQPAALTLTSTQASPNGAVITVYRPAGALLLGSHGIVEGRETVIDDGSGAPAIDAEITT